MMVWLSRVKAPVFPFALEGHEEKEFTGRPQEARDFLEGRRRLHEMLQSVMAKDGVHRGAGNGLGVGNKLDAGGANGGREKITQIEGESAPAFQAGQIPAETGAVFQNDVGLAELGRQFFRAQAGHPGNRRPGDGALVAVVALAGLAEVMALCLICDHEEE